MAVNIDNYRFVFVAGLHRSGTSILAKILRDQAQFSGFRNTGVPEDEGQHLQMVYKNDNFFGGPGKFGLHPEAHLTEESHLATEANTQTLFEQWAKYWNLEKEILVEKSPPNLLMMRFLQKLFPKSAFITIIRHPIPTSLATVKWSHNSLDELFTHWLHCHQMYQSDKTHIHKHLEIRYEDFTQNLTAILEQISSFLETPIKQILHLPVRKNVSDNYFKTWEELPNEQKKFLIDKYETKFNEWGYSLVNY